ncbi:MAG: tetratricopeptide repeat protein, partial [Bacteroidetes bacterium]|nr:tetratricopeptide repeat protein [Bacteroidota bacterium]
MDGKNLEIQNSENFISNSELKIESGDIVTGGKTVTNIYLSPDYKKFEEEYHTLKIKIAETKDNQELLIALNGKLEFVLKQKKEFEQGVIKLAETFSRIEINTDRLKKAQKLFSEGKFTEADEILKSEELKDEQDKLLGAEETLEEKLESVKNHLINNSNEWLIKAQTTALRLELKNRFELTLEYFNNALLSSRNLWVLLNYGYFLAEHNQYHLAIPIYREAVAILELNKPNKKNNEYNDTLAGTLNNLAALEDNNNEYEQAREHYLEALNIYRELAENNPNAYRPHVAMTLNNLAILEYNNNEYEQAREHYLEALNIRRELAEINPNAYRPHVAMTLNNLAILEYNNNEYEQAREHYLEALNIRRELAENNPNAYRPDVATTLNNLAALEDNNNEYEQ